MSNEEEEMIQEIENRITIDMEQTTEEDLARVESSKYCPFLKRLKTDIIMENYWTDKDKEMNKTYGVVTTQLSHFHLFEVIATVLIYTPFLY